LYGVKEALVIPAAEQEKKTLCSEPPERPAGRWIRVWGFNDLDE
jgi:hypothetical protein